jgi:S1-C subfamily serine protease
MKLAATVALALMALSAVAQDDKDLAKVRELQKKLHDVIEKVKPAYVFIGGGSAVCIDPDGWILTNHHVAGEQKNLQVRFTGGKQYMADVIGFDPLGDISLVKVRNGKDLPFIEMGDSDALKIGQPVIAVGNPFLLGNENWEPTITHGIVSALHRYQDWYMDAIQTDAQINPGNSGGPLITMEGKVVGINGRIEVRRFSNRVNTGIGYAIPSNQIRRYLPHFKAGGRVRHGFVQGATFGETGDSRYENIGEYGDGVFLAGVEEGSPVEKAKMREGDIVTHIEGLRCFNLNRLHGIVGTFPPGSTVKMTGKRWDKEKKAYEPFEAKVLLGDPELLTAQNALVGNLDFGFLPSFDFDDLGVEVDEVAEGGPGAKAGLKPGDVIVRMDGVRVKAWKDMKAELGRKKPGQTIKLAVLRGEKELEVELVLAERKDE